MTDDRPPQPLSAAASGHHSRSGGGYDERDLYTRLGAIEKSLEYLVNVTDKNSDRLSKLEAERNSALLWGIIVIGSGFVGLVIYVATKLSNGA